MKTQYFLLLAKKLKDLEWDKFYAVCEQNPASLSLLVRAKCYYDLKFFSKFFFTDEQNGVKVGHCKDPFNKMHLDFFKDFDPEERGIETVILAARGSAKTTLVCLIYALHKICYSTEKYILLLSSTLPRTREKTRDIHSEVTHNDLLKRIFFLTFEGNRQASKESFVINSRYGECYVHGQSFNSQIRGAKYKNSRITLALLDDVVHGEEVFSEEQRIKALRQFNTDLKLSSQPGTNFIYIGTRIHNEDLGSELARRPTWKSREYPAFERWPDNMKLWNEWEDIYRNPSYIKEVAEAKAHKFYLKNKKEMIKGAKVLWPERENVYDLMKERLDIGPRAFDAEKQMIPFLSGESLFQNISYFQWDTRDGMEGFFIPKFNKFIPYDSGRFTKYYALDPATGERKKATQKKTLSKSARIIAAKDEKTGFVYVIDCWMDRKPPSKIIYEMYDLHHHHDFYKMGFEENLFKELFGDYIKIMKEKWRDDHKIKLELPTIPVWNSIKKEQRIYGIEPKVSSGKILINKHIAPDFLAQLKTYPNSDHNDGLDALEILMQVIERKNDFQPGIN